MTSFVWKKIICVRDQCSFKIISSLLFHVFILAGCPVARLPCWITFVCLYLTQINLKWSNYNVMNVWIKHNIFILYGQLDNRILRTHVYAYATPTYRFVCVTVPSCGCLWPSVRWTVRVVLPRIPISTVAHRFRMPIESGNKLNTL